MDSADPNKDGQHIPPCPTPSPHSSLPSPLTPPFLFEASLVVRTSSLGLILQDYRDSQRQEKACGCLTTVFRQSSQNPANCPDLRHPQPPNLQRSPPLSPPPIITVSNAFTKLLNQGRHIQIQAVHKDVETAPIQHCPSSVAISDPLSHDQPFLRPTRKSCPVPQNIPSALPGQARNATRSQYQHSSTAERVTLLTAPLALYFLQDQGPPSKVLQPHWSLDLPGTRRPLSRPLFEQKIRAVSHSTPSDMSFTNFFKRPRTKSENAATSPEAGNVDIDAFRNRTAFRYRPLGPTLPVPPSGPAVPVAGLSGIGNGTFYEAGRDNPNSPLRNSQHASPFDPPPGPPQIQESQIGGKFPSPSLGPGSERRQFKNPFHQGRTRTSTTTNQLSDSRDHMIADIVQGQFGVRDIETDSRLSRQFEWSPRESVERRSISADGMRRREGFRGHQPPSSPPKTPLPRLPLLGMGQNFRKRRAISSPTSPSLSLYENTHQLLELSSPSKQSAAQHIIRRSSNHISASSDESILQSLMSNVNHEERNPSVKSFARVSLVRSDGSEHSRNLSVHETSAFEQEVSDCLTDPSSPVLPQIGYINQGRVSLEYLENASDFGPGGSQTSSSSAMQHGIVRSGTPPLLFGTRALGSRNVSQQPSYGVRSQDDEQDWETVADSQMNMRRNFDDVEASAGTGSSLADVSDSSQPSGIKSMAGGRVLVHPAHPRYQHSWSLLHDVQSGAIVLTPEYSGSALPNRNAYQHPTPLSTGHVHPFVVPPPQMGQLRNQQDAKLAMQVMPSDTTGDLFGRDKEWSSTAAEVTSLSNGEVSPVRRGSFAKIAVTGVRANVTGTPDGTGAREVGSSLADESSPPEQEFSVDSRTAKVLHRRTIDGSLDSATANAPGNFVERILNHRIFKRDSDVDSFENLFASTSVQDLSPEIRQHRQHLVDNSLLPRLPSPPVTELKRFSVPIHLLGSTSSTTMAKSDKITKTTATGVALENKSNVRMRSPHRSDHAEDISTGILTPFPVDNPHRATPNLPCQTRRQARQAKLRAKDKVSDGESSPEVKVPAVVFEQPRFVNETATLSPPTLHSERRRTQNQAGSFINNACTAETRAPWVGPYGDFIRDMRGPPTRTGRIQRPIPPNRPVARAESPHLHRLPRPEGPAIEKREKELSRVFLALCAVFFPILIIYGHGFMDGIMSRLSRGEIVAFRKPEKLAALVIGYTLFVLICVGLGLVAVFVL